MRSLLLLICLSCCAPLLAQERGHAHAKTVRDFVAASNRQDVEAMLAATDAEFRWIQVVGDRTTIEVAGHEDLRSWLQAYFTGTPDASAEVGPIAVHGAFASTVETSSWTRKDGTRTSQSATSVYEFGPDGRIRFVWYFNAQPAGAGE